MFILISGLPLGLGGTTDVATGDKFTQVYSQIQDSPRHRFNIINVIPIHWTSVRKTCLSTNWNVYIKINNMLYYYLFKAEHGQK